MKKSFFLFILLNFHVEIESVCNKTVHIIKKCISCPIRNFDYFKNLATMAKFPFLRDIISYIKMEIDIHIH